MKKLFVYFTMVFVFLSSNGNVLLAVDIGENEEISQKKSVSDETSLPTELNIPSESKETSEPTFHIGETTGGVTTGVITSGGSFSEIEEISSEIGVMEKEVVLSVPSVKTNRNLLGGPIMLPANASISYSTTGATGGSVTATVSFDQTGVMILNNGGLSAYLFTGNGSFAFDFRDTLGNTGSVIAIVTWILPPEYLPCNKITDIPQEECRALIDFYYSTSGSGWAKGFSGDIVANKPRMTGTLAGNWQGVTVAGGHVTSLSFDTNKLKGSLSSSLGDLAFIKTFRVINNPNLGGSLPKELGNRTDLENFNISMNRFSGALPSEFSAWGKIKNLNLWENQLEGELPDSYGNRTTLEVFALENNKISGVLPASYGNWTKLTTFTVKNNKLEGILPSTYGSWTGITRFEVGNNSISGTIPDSYGNWKNMGGSYGFNIQDNRISGDIPASLLQWTAVSKNIAVANNCLNTDLSGTIGAKVDGNAILKQWSGDWIMNTSTVIGSGWRTMQDACVLPAEEKYFPCKQVTDIPKLECRALIDFYYSTSGSEWAKGSSGDIAANKPWLKGTLAGNWQGVTVAGGHVTSLSFDTNKLKGSLSSSLGDLTFIKTFRVINNPNLGGSLPSEFKNWKDIENFNISMNRFSGALPSEFSAWGKIKNLNLWENQLEGELPDSYGNRTTLEVFALENNKISGSLPASYGNWTKLTTFTVKNNKLEGILPSSYGNWTGLVRFEIGNNGISGTIPDSYGNWTKMGDSLGFNIQDNRISGDIPASLLQWTAVSKNIAVANNCLNTDLSGTIGAKVDGNAILKQWSGDWIMNTSTVIGSGWRTMQDACVLPAEEKYFPCKQVTDIPKVECVALVDFYYGTNGNGWTKGFSGDIVANKPWLKGINAGNWTGITVTSGHVTNIGSSFSLSNNNLVGELKPSLGDLHYVEEFRILQNPELKGTLPKELRNRKKLKTLSIRANGFDGILPPELSEWENIQLFGIWSNNFKGTLPKEYGQWTTIKSFLIENNQFEGQLPSEYGSRKLDGFTATNNKLSGILPASYGNWTGITRFEIGNNNISGIIPESYANRGSLRGGFGFNIQNNKISGDIPAGIASWANISGNIFVSNNCLNTDLTGSIGNFIDGNAGERTVSGGVMLNSTNTFVGSGWRTTQTGCRVPPVIPTPTPASPSSGGGGGGMVILRQDTCLDGDFSSSFYDKSCGEKKEKITLRNKKKAKSEYKTAYDRARKIGITTVDEYRNARADEGIIRAEAAKMISIFAQKILYKKPDTNKTACSSFSDMNETNEELQGYIKTSCQLGIMGYHANGQDIKSAFDPNIILTRAEFGTMLSRLLRGNQYAGEEGHRYQSHLEALKEKKIMNYITTPQQEETRGNVFIMLERASQ